MFIYETSERSNSINQVQKLLDNSEVLFFIDFEGYTVKDEKISLLLDRAKYIGDKKTNNLELYRYILNQIGKQFVIKKEFAKSLQVPWYFIVYTEKGYSIVIDMLNEGEEIAKFDSFEKFGNWTLQFRQYRMRSRYEESGLPEIDIKLREVGTPWPGNLDKALCIDGKVVALIEYQKTSKSSVRKHDNNNFFANSYTFNEKENKFVISRKGDEYRWKVLHEFSLQSQLPILVIVWSEVENTVGLKIINDITYTKNPSEDNFIKDQKSGISWREIRYVDLKDVENSIIEMLELKN